MPHSKLKWEILVKVGCHDFSAGLQTGVDGYSAAPIEGKHPHLGAYCFSFGSEPLALRLVSRVKFRQLDI